MAFTVEELEQRASELKDSIRALHEEHAGASMDDEARDRWNSLNADYERVEADLLEKRSRMRRIEAISRDARHLESEPPVMPRQRFDFRERTTDALRAVERLHAEGEMPEAAILRLDEVIRSDETGEDATYIAAAANPYYVGAFSKLLRFGAESVRVNMTDREREAVYECQRAASLTGSAGGFAVPIQIDPTAIPTSDGAINPLRQISRVDTVTGAEYRLVTAGAVTAAFAAEAATASDNAPTLAQPIAYPEKAQAFIPYSIEIGMDWGGDGFAQNMMRLLSDARDLLEAQKFVAGLGHTSHEPEGLLVGATAIISTAAATTIAIGDVYGLREALPPRFRPQAKVLASLTALDKVRRLVGPGNTTELGVWRDGPPPAVINWPAYEQSSMPSTFTSGATVITTGDFSQFLIADRIGMTIEPISMLFASGTPGLPTGQRGLYAWWRTTSKVLQWQAFRSLKLT